jgi:hypothetical protein
VKKIMYLWLAVALVLLGASVVMAGPIYINDDPALGPYTDLQQWTSVKPSPGPYLGNQVWHDVEGAEFSTQSVNIATNPYSIQIVTNNQPGGWVVAGINWGVADIALDVSSATTRYDAYTTNHFAYSGINISSPFELAIDMQGYMTGSPGQAGQANAFLVNVDQWTTTFNIVNQSGVAGNYGGGWKASTAPNSANVQPVEAIASYDEDDIIATALLSWVPTGTTYAGHPEYLLTLSNFALSDGTPINDLTQPYDFLWATSECGNDIVESPVPVPPSFLLLGSGLLGLVGLRWRKFKDGPAVG